METIEIQDEGIVQIMIKESDTAGYIRELFKKVVWSFGLSINSTASTSVGMALVPCMIA